MEPLRHVADGHPPVDDRLHQAGQVVIAAEEMRRPVDVRFETGGDHAVGRVGDVPLVLLLGQEGEELPQARAQCLFAILGVQLQVAAPLLGQVQRQEVVLLCEEGQALG